MSWSSLSRRRPARSSPVRAIRVTPARDLRAPGVCQDRRMPRARELLAILVRRLRVVGRFVSSTTYRARLQLARGSCRAPVNVNGGPLRRISFGSISETRPLHRQRATRSQISRSPCGPGTSQRLSPRRRDALDGLTPCCCERETSPSAGLQVKTEVLHRRGVRDVLRWSDWRPRASMLPGGQRVTVAVKVPVVHPASFSLPLACRSR